MTEHAYVESVVEAAQLLERKLSAQYGDGWALTLVRSSSGQWRGFVELEGEAYTHDFQLSLHEPSRTRTGDA